MKNKVTRRKFLQQSGAGAVVVSSGMLSFCSGQKAGAMMPKRPLGKTGLQVSILSFGGGSQFLKNKDGEWEKLLQKALDSGINLFDTAPNYTISKFHIKGGSHGIASCEERYGTILPHYRDKVYISTKLDDRDPALARKSVEASLKRLKTDYIDILFIHDIKDRDVIADIEKGVYKEMVKMKDEGMIRHIGFSSMDSAERSKDLLENLEFDAALLALNPTRYRNFGEIALPVAREKNVGVIAIKVVRGLVGKDASAKELLEYAWSEGQVSSALIGHFGKDKLKENVKLAIDYGHSAQASIDPDELESRLAAYAGPHALCWARPGYRDAGIVV